MTNTVSRVLLRRVPPSRGGFGSRLKCVHVETSPYDASDLQAASTSISRAIENHSLFAGRLGETELLVWTQALSDSTSLKWRTRAKAKINAGIWPPTGRQLVAFAAQYETSFSCATHVGVWGSLPNENAFIDKAAPLAAHVALRALDPVLLAAGGVAPWTASLRGMTVLVVSPFADLAASQIEKAAVLFKSDFDVLPPITVVPQTPPQSQALNVPLRTWRALLDQSKRQLDRNAPNVDAVLVSAGSYGMPLAAHASGHGLPTVYIGGALQLLFGIEGSRWKDSEELGSIKGTGWLSQMRSRKPWGANLVEGGAYW